MRNWRGSGFTVSDCRLLIQERADNAADTADIHDAGDTEVQVAGPFSVIVSPVAAEEQRHALHYRAREKGC